MAGAPAALQIVGSRYGDSQLLKDAEIIDLVLNGKAETEVDITIRTMIPKL
jgi:Asp-tRNA(Asn)/Glu-tRNA(Gln) amidotransferase A subunit family amidase